MAGRRGRMKMNPNFVAEVKNTSGVSEALLKNARRTGQLNISNRNLSEIPHSVFSLNEAPSASNRSTLAFVDDGDAEKWWEGTELTKLTAASNRIRYITEELGNLRFLTSLDLYDNEITVLPASIGELMELRFLNVSINQLQSLPESLCRCINLVHVDIHRNLISVLPRFFGELTDLEYLDVSENQLTSIHESLMALRRLRQFRAKKNKLQCIPESFANLTSLTHLDLSTNKLTIVPASLGELSRLEILDLRQNSLTRCPNLANCTDMKELYLGENTITNIDYSICRLPNLATLDFHFNKITEVPIAITSLESLIRLDLGNNDITGLPYEIGKMQNMSILIIDGNPIRSIRRDIINRGTEAIKKYLISRMSEDDGPKKDELNVKDGPNNMGVFGDSNEVDPHDIGRTQSLELNNKELASIHPDVWLSLQHINLKVVHLKRNKFQKIPPEIFNYSKSLVTLDISVNKLTVLPEELGLLTNLQHLDVSSNRISKVPVSLGKLVKMRHIDLSLNSFTEIPEVVLTLHNLEHLFFNSNDIKEIDVNGIIKLARLKTLDLQNNNLENVPPELGLCDQLTCLKLEGNCFRIPRPQLLSKGTGAVLEYLRGRIPR